MQVYPIEGAKSIAWFRLAQLIKQREKEKALGIYKLLSYSLENKAYALQVEADLLWSFEDEGAMEKYKQAAFLYKKEKNMVLAASIYEHLREINPQDINSLSSLVELYARMDWPDRMEERFKMLLDQYEQKKITKDQLVKTIKLVKELLIEEHKDTSLKHFLNFVETKQPQLVAI